MEEVSLFLPADSKYAAGKKQNRTLMLITIRPSRDDNDRFHLSGVNASSDVLVQMLS